MVGAVLEDWLLSGDAGRTLAYVVRLVIVVGGRPPPACKQSCCGPVDPGVPPAVGGGNEFLLQGAKEMNFFLYVSSSDTYTGSWAFMDFIQGECFRGAIFRWAGHFAGGTLK